MNSVGCVLAGMVALGVSSICRADGANDAFDRTYDMIRAKHDVVRGAAADARNPLRRLDLPVCMLATNDVEWQQLWSIANVVPHISLPADKAAVAVIGPLYGCPTAELPEIAEISDRADGLLVTYRIHSVPTSVCTFFPVATVVANFVESQSWQHAPESIDESGHRQVCRHPQDLR